MEANLSAATTAPGSRQRQHESRMEIPGSVVWSLTAPISGPMEAAMSRDRRPSDTAEIERIARMARESRDFYKGLAQALEPQQDRKAAEAQQPDKGVNDN